MAISADLIAYLDDLSAISTHLLQKEAQLLLSHLQKMAVVRSQQSHFIDLERQLLPLLSDALVSLM